MDLQTEKQYIVDSRSNPAYFAPIYDEYVRDVYRYAYSLTSNKEAAEDAVSFTFLKAIEKLNDYEVRDKSIKHWLFVIARNYIYKNARHKDPIEKDIKSFQDDSEEILDRLVKEEDIKTVTELFQKLDPNAKEIIRLKIWEDMSFEEISEIIGEGLSTIKMRYYRGLEKIRTG